MMTNFSDRLYMYGTYACVCYVWFFRSWLVAKFKKTKCFVPENPFS